MNGGTCSGSKIQCVHVRVATCACFPFLLIGFRESTATVEYTLHHGISQRECLRLAPCQPRAHPLSLQLHRLYRAPQGRALIYLKDEVDAKLPALSLPSRSILRIPNFHFKFLSLFTCQFMFLVIHSNFLHLIRHSNIRVMNKSTNYI